MPDYRVIPSSLNVRSGPGTKYEAVATLSQGDVISPLDTTAWLPVEMEDGTVGWLATQYLEIALAEEAGPIPAPPSGDFSFGTKEGTIEAIKAECDNQGLTLAAQKAYVLATTEWETARTFQPVREGLRISEAWRKANLRYYPYYGRGYVQLTWKANYTTYTARLRERFPGEDIDLVAQPDQAMVPKYALFILVDGFKTGAFTGKKLTDFVNEDKTDFFNARTCINGHDKAQEIAALAEKYLEDMA